MPTINGTVITDMGPTGVPCSPQSIQGGEASRLTGCLAMVEVRRNGVSTLKLPEEGHSLAPWVAIVFEGTGSTITVSNQSSPATNPQHVACIQSFEFGYSDGLTCRVTIHDEQGGSFVQFMSNLLKQYLCLQNGSPASVRMKVQFGWSKSGCGTSISPAAISRCFYCLSDSVETNYRDGKFHFEITGKDLCHRMFEGGTQTIYGGTGDAAIPITVAIRRFMTQDCPPNVGSVRFCRMEGGSCQPCPFKYGTGAIQVGVGIVGSFAPGSLEGPRGKWIAAGQDKLRVVMRWLEGNVTDRDKSWIPQYNSEVPGGEVIFWEDSKPTSPQPDPYWDANCLGTYIVNGGKKSSVIEFSPKIRWDFARLTSVGGQLGRNTMNGTGNPGAQNSGTPGNNRTQQPCAGHATQITANETAIDNNNRNAEQIIGPANAQGQRALKILTDNVEADLVIVGDPTILPPSEAMWSKNCSIIVVNPYFLRRANFVNIADDLEWLVQPICNEVLSSKAWICKSICHKIEAGKYTTTIGVFLTAPGADTPAGTPLGAWTNGWVPTIQC